MTVPNSAPTAAVAAMAKAPQKVTRTAPLRRLAPPTWAPTAPSAARKTSDAPDTPQTSQSLGMNQATRRGSAAPTAKVSAEVNAAWIGRACDEPGQAGNQDLPARAARGRHADNEARGGDDAIVGAEHGGAEPADALDEVTFAMNVRPAHIGLAPAVAGSFNYGTAGA